MSLLIYIHLFQISFRRRTLICWVWRKLSDRCWTCFSVDWCILFMRIISLFIWRELRYLMCSIVNLLGLNWVLILLRRRLIPCLRKIKIRCSVRRIWAVRFHPLKSYNIKISVNYVISIIKLLFINNHFKTQ